MIESFFSQSHVHLQRMYSAHWHCGSPCRHTTTAPKSSATTAASRSCGGSSWRRQTRMQGDCDLLPPGCDPILHPYPVVVTRPGVVTRCRVWIIVEGRREVGSETHTLCTKNMKWANHRSLRRNKRLTLAELCIRDGNWLSVIQTWIWCKMIQQCR